MEFLFGGIDLQNTTADLVFFDAFKQGAEIAFAKALVTFALDEFKKNRPDHGFRENLQQNFLLSVI